MASKSTDAGESSVPNRGPRSFATTQWTLVLEAADADRKDRDRALETLCRRYWYPVYRFARSRSRSAQDAEDLTQGFFADFLQRGALARADAKRGRFRTFLLGSFVHFESHQRERAGRLKRGGGHEIVSYEAIREAERRWDIEPACERSPEKSFDRQWALSLLEHVFASLRRDYVAAGREAWFDELRQLVWGGHDAASPSEIGGRLGASAGAVRVAASRLRRRFREELRREVAQTVADTGEVDSEMRHLLASLSA